MIVCGEEIREGILDAAWRSVSARFTCHALEAALVDSGVPLRLIAFGATSQFLQNQKRRGAVTFNRRTRQWVKLTTQKDTGHE